MSESKTVAMSSPLFLFPAVFLLAQGEAVALIPLQLSYPFRFKVMWQADLYAQAPGSRRRPIGITGGVLHELGTFCLENPMDGGAW